MSLRGIKYYDKKNKIKNIPIRQNVSEEVQEIILKVFGDDIKRDLDLDLNELERTKNDNQK